MKTRPLSLVLLFLCILCHFYAYSNPLKRSTYSASRSPHEIQYQKKLEKMPYQDPKKQAQATLMTDKPKKKYKRRPPKRNKVKTLKGMSFDELMTSKNRLIAEGYKEIAIKYIDRMMRLCDDIQMLSILVLELADLYYDTGQYEKAEVTYTEFAKYYPGNPKAEYALFKAIKSSFVQTNHTDRDQSKTHTTLALTEAFLENDVFKTHKNDVLHLKSQCYQKIIEHEIHVINFYLNQNRLKASELRITSLREHWLPKVSSMEPQVLLLEIALAEKSQQPELVKQKKFELDTRYPAYSSIRLAQQANEKPLSFLLRF